MGGFFIGILVHKKQHVISVEQVYDFLITIDDDEVDDFDLFIEILSVLFHIGIRWF